MLDDKINNFFEKFPQEKIVVIDGLESYTILGQVIELLQLADENIIKMDGNATAKCLNPMPEIHYFVGKFAPETFYFSYNQQDFYINWHGYFANNLTEHFSAQFANHILGFIGSTTGIYHPKEFYEFYLLLNENEVEQILSQNLFSLHKPTLEKFEDINPIELKGLLSETHSIIQEIQTKNSDFIIPLPQSLVSSQAVQWLNQQKPFIQDLLNDKSFLSTLEPNEKLRLIFNAFVVMARQTIADPRVIDYKYRTYPIFSKSQFHKIIDTLEPTITAEQFLLSDEILNAFVHHQKQDKTLDKIFQN